MPHQRASRGYIDSELQPLQCNLMYRILIALICLANAASAGETRKPNLIYYPVHGNTAQEIKDDMYQNGPKIRGDNKLSFTIPAIKITQKPVQSGDACRYKSYRISSVFSFVLPKLAGSKGVPKQTLANWNGFATYLHNHENQHREIWLKCLSEFEHQAKSLNASDCETLDKETASAFEAKKLACLEGDLKLDFYHTKEALKTPFLREAMGK
jgi:predicted secreted Zn-dependent protease